MSQLGSRRSPQAEYYFSSDIFPTVNELAEHCGVTLAKPRQCNRQVHRNNYDVTTIEEYYRVAVYIPYVESVIASLEARFIENDDAQIALSRLHPMRIRELDREEYALSMATVSQFYGINNFVTSALTWYDHWRNREDALHVLSKLSFLQLLSDTKYYPGVQKAIRIFLTLPATTCTVERSFSTLRRVKTWLRSTMTTQRLSGLCMLSVHRAKIDKNREHFMNSVIDVFGSDSRRLQFLFERIKPEDDDDAEGEFSDDD